MRTVNVDNNFRMNVRQIFYAFVYLFDQQTFKSNEYAPERRHDARDALTVNLASILLLMSDTLVSIFGL